MGRQDFRSVRRQSERSWQERPRRGPRAVIIPPRGSTQTYSTSTLWWWPLILSYINPVAHPLSFAPARPRLQLGWVRLEVSPLDATGEPHRSADASIPARGGCVLPPLPDEHQPTCLVLPGGGEPGEKERLS